VKLFVDEDTGSSVGRALHEVGVDTWSVSRNKRNRIQPGTLDRDWIPLVAANQRLILSRNVRMLESEEERRLLIESKAAAVYLPQHVGSLSLLRLLLRKWDWLVSMYENQPRPFAYRVTATGRAIPEDLVGYVPRRRRSTWPGRPSGSVVRPRRGPASHDQSDLPL
jgi:hypothetical protein